MLTIAVAMTAGLLSAPFLVLATARSPHGFRALAAGAACGDCGYAVDLRTVLTGRQPAGCDRCRRLLTRWRPALAVAAVAVAGLLAVRLGSDPALPAFLALGLVGLPLAVVDTELRRLPDALTLPAYPLLILLLGAAALAGSPSGSFLRALAGMAALYGFFFVSVVLAPHSTGLGDVKLAGLVGLALGWLGWTELIAGLLAALYLGVAVGVLRMVTRFGSLRSPFAFGPMLLAGALAATVLGASLGAGSADGP